MNASKLSFKIIPFALALNCFGMLSAAENTFYFWGDATGHQKMPNVVDAAAWSTSRSEYVPPSEGTNVNSTDANWVIASSHKHAHRGILLQYNNPNP